MGGDDSQKLLPWRGIAILSRAQQIFRSVRNQQLYRKDRMLAGSRFPFSPPAAARGAPNGGCTGQRRGVCGQGAGVTMTLPGETEAGTAGMQPLLRDSLAGSSRR